MDLSAVQFINSSEEINGRPDEYWTLVMDIARRNSVKRVVRCRQVPANPALLLLCCMIRFSAMSC
jgi:tyrosyl-tRNA synthetase